ncbi:BLOC-1-related complex subunit 8 homolog [Trichonephila inaurata madagascariensis]|uniref:BLOC-1-related complex subunit 8 homolog n=1 Tax=Trichonephila inaurata madagascariensis TaxID=2747483 RepID=A0A8X7CLA3_9ARAC|nr:BLOC-1-related complex subunit 8 homolog [Trichonephila inaurata madagascariensis]
MMDSFHVPLSHSAGAPPPLSTDPELESKVKKASEKISENLHIFANEPSLACYRLQEHIHKSLPQLVLKRVEVHQMYRNLQGKCYDLEYAINAVKEMQNSHEHFQNITQLIYQAITTKQRLNAEESKKTDKKKTSMYQRISGSFDLPASFLPAVATGLSSSASVSADLKSSPAQAIKSSSTSSSPRRSRASSVSSVPSRASLSRQHSASCSPSKKNLS